MADPKADAAPAAGPVSAPDVTSETRPATEVPGSAPRETWKPDVPEGFAGINASVIS